MLDMRTLIKNNEQILWEGRPDKKVTVLEAIFNPMLVFALIWFAIDMAVIGGAVMAGDSRIFAFLIPFMLIHMMPVWIYLGGVLTATLRWKNTRFMITTGGLYISGGVLTFNYEMKPWTDIGHITIHQGVFDRMMNVGDVVFTCNHGSTAGHSSGSHSHASMSIRNISDFQSVFQLVNNMQTDVYSDTMYPNALRPETNPGYNTQYSGQGSRFGN